MWKRKNTTRRNPYLEQAGDHGEKSEKRIANSVGGGGTLASGAVSGDKGDFTLAGKYPFRGECKSTINDSLGLKYAWLQKIRHEALETNSVPCLTISFVTGDGRARDGGDWVAIPKWLFKEVFGGEDNE